MGKLFLVPTPIGNLGDMTFRAVETLKTADLILAEDTRVSSKLLKYYNIHKPLVSFHMHNEHRKLSEVISKLKSGFTIAVISDAGTPGISDPGFLLVREAIMNDIEVNCLPGPTALIPALVVSGLPSERFTFEGFLPIKKGRKSRLEFLSNESRTMIFYESPHKIIKTITDFKTYFGGDRKISISKEISKIFESTTRGTIDDVLLFFENKKPKGEYVIVLSGTK